MLRKANFVYLKRCKTLPWACTWRPKWKTDRKGWVLDGSDKKSWLHTMRPDWYIDKQDLRFVLESLWLDRAWIFQEFVLSHHIILLSCNEAISWEEFLAVI